MRLTPFTPLKLLWHSDQVRAAVAGERRFPISVEWDFSNVCNHHCAWCSFGEFRAEEPVHFPFARGLDLIRELDEGGTKSVTVTGGGEPLMHPNRVALFEALRASRLAYGLVTNGRLLCGETAAEVARGATFVRVSLDAGQSQTHQLLHATVRPEFDLILQHLADLRTLAPALTLGVSFCVFDVNCGEIPQAAGLVESAGADYLEVRPVFPTEWRGGAFTNPLTETHLDEARRGLEQARASAGAGFEVLGLIERFDQVWPHAKPYTQCRIGPLTTIVSATGDLYHCCQQRGMPEFRVGSLIGTPFSEVWGSEAHQAMLARIDVGACPPCRYDGYNQIIESAVLADAMHRDFI